MVFSKHIYLLILLSFTAFRSDSDQFTWSTARKLIWGDFKGKPVAGMKAAALTYTDIKMQAASDENGNIKLTIDNFFDKNKSWTKNKTSKELLEHEQLHFDITEVFTRRLRSKLTSIATPEAIRSGKMSKESSKIMKEWKECEDKYDSETDHGTIPAKQQEWQQKVLMWLNEKP